MDDALLWAIRAYVYDHFAATHPAGHRRQHLRPLRHQPGGRGARRRRPLNGPSAGNRRRLSRPRPASLEPASAGVVA